MGFTLAPGNLDFLSSSQDIGKREKAIFAIERPKLEPVEVIKEMQPHFILNFAKNLVF